MTRATLRDFAQASDAAAATRKKLQKQAILGTYLRSLENDEEDLRLAVRYSAGRAFPATDERVLAVGGAIVSEVLRAMLRLDPDVFWQQVTRSGEIGEALTRFWPEPTDGRAGPILQTLADAFDDLAASGSQERKREILRELFSRCVHPREAVYLAKIIFGDLRTGMQEGVLQAAVAEAFGKPLKAIQQCQLLVGDLDEVAVLAKHDRLDCTQFKLFHPLQFMLATPQEISLEAAATMNGRSFFAEDKLDGIRAQVHKQGDGDACRIAIYTRTMDRTDESFPEVVAAMRKLPGDFLLDGEIVPYCDGCVMPFAHLQRRLGRKSLTPKILKDNPVVFIAFDLLYRDGRLLLDEPLRTRRAEIEKLDTMTTDVLTVATPEEIDLAFAHARGRRNEGIVLKDPESTYSPGRRGQSWLKIKTHLPTLDCVVTTAEYGHGKRRNVLSDYTFAVWDRDATEDGAQLVNIGKAYSGVTDEEIAQLTELFLKLSIAQRGHIHLVRPQIVMEIACDQIQKSDRHSSGYALRFPRIKRIRWDKLPTDADRLQRVIEIYQSEANFGRGRVEKAEIKAEPTLFDGLG